LAAGATTQGVTLATDSGSRPRLCGVQTAGRKDEGEKVTKVAVIKFQAQLWQGRSTVDGGLLVTLSMNEKELKQFSQLLECKKPGVMLEVAVIPVILKQANKANDGKPKRKERYPYK